MDNTLATRGSHRDSPRGSMRIGKPWRQLRLKTRDHNFSVPFATPSSPPWISKSRPRSPRYTKTTPFIHLLFRFRKAGYAAIDRICDYYANIESRPVVAQVEPGFLVKLLPDHAPEDGEPIEQITKDFQGDINVITVNVGCTHSVKKPISQISSCLA